MPTVAEIITQLTALRRKICKTSNLPELPEAVTFTLGLLAATGDELVEVCVHKPHNNTLALVNGKGPGRLMVALICRVDGSVWIYDYTHELRIRQPKFRHEYHQEGAIVERSPYAAQATLTLDEFRTVITAAVNKVAGRPVAIAEASP